MALNQKIYEGHSLSLNVGTGKKSGDPVVYGKMPGVCETDADANGLATVDLRGSVYSLSVKGINAGGNVAVNVGDTVYFTAGDTPPLSAKATGVEFGTVVGITNPYTVAIGQQAVASAATTTVHVKLKTY